MLQKFRSSILFQLICMVALIFAVLFTTFHAAQAYVRSLSVKGAETLAESLVTQADEVQGFETFTERYRSALPTEKAIS